MVSCNVSFASIGLDLGRSALQAQASAFGFGQQYLDGLSGQAASVFPDNLDEPQTALSAIGQFDVRATPLEMAQVAATIANNGQGMRPYLVDEVQAPDLSVLEKTDPEEMPERAMSAQSASELTQMMVEVVDRGTGTTAQLPNIKVAGKTGTAQSRADRPPYAWFVSFAPADDPQVAVAVLVEDAGVARDAISGSGLAAPIAKRVMEAVLQ
jgi:peptidoglycan glycosyltransferase